MLKHLNPFSSQLQLITIEETEIKHESINKSSNLAERSHRSRNNSHKTRKMEWKQDSERRLRWESNPTSLERIVEIRLWRDWVEIPEGEDIWIEGSVSLRFTPVLDPSKIIYHYHHSEPGWVVLCKDWNIEQFRRYLLVDDNFGNSYNRGVLRYRNWTSIWVSSSLPTK